MDRTVLIEQNNNEIPELQRACIAWRGKHEVLALEARKACEQPGMKNDAKNGAQSRRALNDAIAAAKAEQEHLTRALNSLEEAQTLNAEKPEAAHAIIVDARLAVDQAETIYIEHWDARFEAG